MSAGRGAQRWWLLVVLGAGTAAIAATAWSTNDEPGARTFAPTVLAAVVAAGAALALGRRLGAPPAALGGSVALLGLATAVAAYALPAEVIERRVRGDEDLARRAEQLLDQAPGIQVTVTRGGEPPHGLVLSPGVPAHVDGACSRHLFDGWWEYAELDGASCPIGFTFTPGGG